MQKQSLTSVKVKYLNFQNTVDDLEKLAKRCGEKELHVLEIRLFGSLASGRYTPFSDADLLIVLKDDNLIFRDRIPRFLRYFLKAQLPVDVFPYTKREIQTLLDQKSFFIMRAIKGKLLYKRHML